MNTTGYRIPAEDQFRRWAEQVSPGFRFAVKFNSFRLAGAGTFEERVRLLGDRLGPIRVLVGSARDEGLLALTLGSFDPELKIAFDFRHDSWEGVESDLPPNAVHVNDLESAARFRYLRLREPPYDKQALSEWADRIRPLLADGVEVYCYFKHEEQPEAPGCGAPPGASRRARPPRRSWRRSARRLREIASAPTGSDEGSHGFLARLLFVLVHRRLDRVEVAVEETEGHDFVRVLQVAGDVSLASLRGRVVVRPPGLSPFVG